MSIASETDAVDFVRLILDDDANTWSNFGSEPDYIERAETTDRQTKTNRADNGQSAIYLWSPDVGSLEVVGAEGAEYVDDEVVQCDVWDHSEDDANDIISDIVQLVYDYWLDNQQTTQWAMVEPDNPADNSAASFYSGAHVENSVQVFLRAVRTIS